MKRVIIGIGWLTIISFVISFIGGFVAGFIAGYNDPGNAAAAGAGAGKDFEQRFGGFVFLISALAAVIGTATGKLPYTQKEAKAPDIGKAA